MPSDYNFDEIIGLIYEAALEPSRWEFLMERLADLLHAVQATLVMIDADQMQNSIVLTSRFDPMTEPEFRERREKEDEWLKRIRNGSNSAVYRGSELIDTRQFLKTPFMQEIGRKNDVAFMLGGLFDKRAAALGGISVLRGLAADDFSEDDKAVLRRILPHLRRAMGIHRRFGELIRQEGQLEASLDRLPEAVLVANEKSRVLIFNKAAETMLKKGRYMKVTGGRLMLDDLQAQSRLERALRQQISSASPTDALILARRKSPLPPLTVRVYPIATSERFFGLEGSERCSVIVISDPADRAVPPQSFLTEAYGLTPAETRVVALALQGKSAREIAETLDRSIHTVRTQLKHIFARVGVRSQSELIARLMMYA